MAKKKDPRLARAGVSGFNKPKRTPKHPTKSHVVVAKRVTKLRLLGLVSRVRLVIRRTRLVPGLLRLVMLRTSRKARCRLRIGLTK